MSRYLEMLKGQKSEMRSVGELPKPSKPGFEGFEGTPEAHFQKGAGGFGGFDGTPDAHFQKKPPGLLEIIKRMASFYGYTDDELAYALNDARQRPDAWRKLIRSDRHAGQFIQQRDEARLP